MRGGQLCFVMNHHNSVFTSENTIVYFHVLFILQQYIVVYVNAFIANIIVRQCNWSRNIVE